MRTYNIRKAIDDQDIPVKLLKPCVGILAVPITKLANLSFNQGIFPVSSKIAKVIPLFKKKEKIKVENYRPISILKTISKILEKLMHKRLYNYLQKFKIIYELQFGFRSNYSTNLALIEIIENIRQSLDNKEFTMGLYLDLSKAFDTVNHEILLNKLEHYGVRGYVNKWFKSYLTNRKQFVQVNNTNSKLLEISIGIPQGSALVPLLFLIYMNDISTSIIDQSAKLMLFSDDTNIFLSGKNPV